MGDWVEDKTAVVRCVGPPDQCQTDQDCNLNLPGVCATNQEGETVDCAYCEDTGYFKHCVPGRKQYIITYHQRGDRRKSFFLRKLGIFGGHFF